MSPGGWAAPEVAQRGDDGAVQVGVPGAATVGCPGRGVRAGAPGGAPGASLGWGAGLLAATAGSQVSGLFARLAAASGQRRRGSPGGRLANGFVESKGS